MSPPIFNPLYIMNDMPIKVERFALRNDISQFEKIQGFYGEKSSFFIEKNLARGYIIGVDFRGEIARGLIGKTLRAKQPEKARGPRRVRKSVKKYYKEI